MVVELQGICKRYGARWVLANLSLQIPRHSVVLLTGSNGAGKTTLLRLLSTSSKPTLGSFRLFGLDPSEQRQQVRRRLALVTHQNHLYGDLTACENLEVSARLRGVRRPLMPLLEEVGLADDAHRFTRTFSAGMMRRLCMARLLLWEPELALLDEPFGALDPEGVALMEELVRRLAKMGTTMIIVTHDIERGKALCDRHLQLHDGRQVGAINPLNRDRGDTRMTD